MDIYELFKSNEVKPLESEIDIEEIIFSMNSIDDKIDWYKRLKAKRNEKITEDINNLKEKKQFLKEVILATLKDIDKKSLNFPGVGKVSYKTNKGKWAIDDEAELISHLRKAEKSGDLDSSTIDEILSTKIIIVKKELNKVLDMWENIDNLPLSVTREKTPDSLTVKMEKDVDAQKSKDNVEIIDSIVDEDGVEDFDVLKVEM